MVTRQQLINKHNNLIKANTIAIYNYGIGGNEVKVDANESIAEIPSNRTLIVQKLTDEAPATPESVYGLETIEDVFQCFEPTVDLCHVDADSAISELVFYKKLYIEIEYATPPNIKANFYKEVSIKKEIRFMCNIKYILCTIFCMCAYLHAAATCSDSISDKFSYKVLENFNYCWDNNIVYEDTNSKDTALFVSSHKYIISPILNAFCNNMNEQTELAKIGYCCKHYLIKVQNKSKKNIQYNSIEINILSNIKSHAPIISKIEELKKQDYTIIDIISEAPVMCLVFVEADYLVAVSYNMFYDFDDVLSFSKFFVQEHFFSAK